MAENIDFNIVFRDMFSGAMSKANKQIAELNDSLNGTKKAASGVSASTMALGGFMSNMAGRAIDGIFDLGKGILKLGMDAEQTQIAFEVMMGSAEAATKHIADLKAFAAATPFEMEDLSDASKLMQNFGISAEKVIPMMSMLGDVSGGNKERFKSLTLAFSGVSAAGKLMGQDLIQFINAGFNPLQVMSEKTGKSMGVLRDEMSKGAISADMVTQAFVDVTSKGGKFYGMMSKQSQTVAGKLSTLIDNLKEIGRQIAEYLLPVVEFLIDNFSTLAKIVGVLVGAFVAYKAAMLISTIVTGGFSAAFGALNAVMLLNPIFLVITALAALTAAFIWAWDNSEEFRGSLTGMWEAMKTIGDNLYDTLIQPFVTLWTGLKDMFSGEGFDGMLNGFMELGQTIKDTLLQPLLQVVKLIDEIAGTDYAKDFKDIAGMKSDWTGGVSKSFDTGYKEGVDSMKKTKAETTIDKSNLLTSQKDIASSIGITNARGSDSLKGEVDKIKSNQPNNVNINIDTLMKIDNIGISNAANPRDDMNSFLNQLEQSLLTIINDVNYVVK